MSSVQLNEDQQQQQNNLAEDPVLVQRLMGDTDGRGLQEIKNSIIEGRQKVQQKLNGGVSQDEFQALTDFVVASNAAEEVIEAFWATTHGK